MLATPGAAGPDSRLRVPGREEWLALSEDQRQAVERRIYDALNHDGDVLAMSESTRHSRPKQGAYRDLDDHFQRCGRKMFLACELGVLYPGEDAFAPDLLAVADVADAERDRDSWRVVDEKRGIDFILELRNKGKADKDLRTNVRDFARLKIPEYFTFDCRKHVLRAWRLLPGAPSYVPIVPQGGQFPSEVLGLELAVVSGRLRFFVGQALVPDARELIDRLQGMVDGQQRSLEEAERQREEAERQRDEAERQRDEAEWRLRSACEALANLVVLNLQTRGLAVSAEQQRRIHACQDGDRLIQWLGAAQTAASAEELLRSAG